MTQPQQTSFDNAEYEQAEEIYDTIPELSDLNYEVINVKPGGDNYEDTLPFPCSMEYNIIYYDITYCAII